MPAGGFVTAIELVGMNLNELTTFATVASGDRLRLDFEPLGDIDEHTLTTNVPTDTNANGYLVSTSCGSGGLDDTGAGELTLTGCGGSADVVVQSMLDGIPTGRAIYSPSVALPATGALTITGTYSGMTTDTLTYTGVPAQVASLAGYQSVSATRRAYETADSAVPAGGTATMQLSVPATTSSVLTVTNTYPVTTEVGQQTLYEWATASTTYSANLSTLLLPAYATAPTYDAATHAVTWTERAGGAAADLVRVGLQVNRDDIPEGRTWRWRLAVARGSAASVTFPTLPGTPTVSFDFNPSATDSVAIDDLTTLRLPGGLAPWRTTAFAATSRAVVGSAGRIVMQTLYSPEL
jgi:hypothetical protein